MGWTWNNPYDQEGYGAYGNPGLEWTYTDDPTAPGGGGVGSPPATTPDGGGQLDPNKDPGFDLSYNGPLAPSFNFPKMPSYTLPGFETPTFSEAVNDPGYSFRAQAGQDALQRAAAAKGILRTSGTLKDLIDYGQNFATQEYSNVFNRALSAYNANYTKAKDLYDPQFRDYQQRFAAEKERGTQAFSWQQQLYQDRLDWAKLQAQLAAGLTGGSQPEPPQD